MSLPDALASAVARREEHGWERAPAAHAALAACAGLGTAPGRLDDVASRFGLDEAATALLGVGLAAEREVAAHLLLGLLAGDDGPGRPTVALALELVGLPVDLAHAHRHLGAHAPLVRRGLVAVTGSDSLLARRVVVPDRVGAALVGDDVPTRLVLSLLGEEVPVEVEGSALVARALESGQALVWVHSPPGRAGAALGAAACRRLGVAALVADLRRAEDDVAPRAAVEALLLEAGLTGAVLVLSGAERLRPEWLWGCVTPVVAVSSEAWDPEWAGDLPLTVAAPRLGVAQRRALWEPLVGEVAADREVVGMPLSPEQVVMVARHASATAAVHDRPLDARQVRDSARELARGRSTRADAAGSATLDDLVLPPPALAEVRRLLDWARHRDEVVALGPLHGKGGKGIGICALFSGSPGTGKTLAAHVVADSLGMDLLQVDLSSIVDKYIGETEKNLERVFADAEATHAVLFFDEADALFGSRSDVKDSKDRYANQEVAYLLQRMEQFDGITVLASNLRGNLDAAFSRRLHFIVSFPDPDEATRRSLWEHHLAGLDTDPGDPPDLPWLAARVEMAGGDIRNMVLSAVYAAVAEGGPLGMRHLDDAVRREHAKLGRRPPAR